MKRVALYCLPQDAREPMGKAIIAGARGCKVEVVPQHTRPADTQHDAAIVLGTKSRNLLDRLSLNGTPYLYVDVGYSHGKQGYWRTSVNAYQPVFYLMHMGKPPDRRERFGWDIKPWREPMNDQHILVINSGASYSHMHKLPLFEDMMVELETNIRRHSQRRIVIRSKPVVTSLSEDLKDAYVAVTYGSNAVVECIRAGVPCIVLVDAPSLPISNNHLSYLESPTLVSDERRLQWLANLAYCQWSVEEFASGEAWAELGPRLGLGA